MTSRHRHLFALAELADKEADVERCRDNYLTSLDADDALTVLLISADEILSAAAERRACARASCGRCGARLPVARHRCRRCRLAAR